MVDHNIPRPVPSGSELIDALPERGEYTTETDWIRGHDWDKSMCLSVTSSKECALGVRRQKVLGGIGVMCTWETGAPAHQKRCLLLTRESFHAVLFYSG